MINTKNSHHSFSPFLTLLSLVLLIISSYNNSILSQDKFVEILETSVVDLNGTKIRYHKSGEGPSLVLLHHVRGQLEYFNSIISALTPHFTVYAIDLPGHGKSDIKEVEYTAQYSNQIMKTFLIEMNLKNTYLVGESIGASLALALSADPDLEIKKVIAFNPFDGVHGIGEGNFVAKLYTKALRNNRIGPRVVNSQKRSIFKKILKGGFHDGDKLDDSLVDLYLATGKRAGYNQAFRNSILNSSAYSLLEDRFSNIAIPVMIVRGESDWMPYNLQNSYGNSIKDLKRKTILEAGHFSVLEKPNEVIKIILDFMLDEL